MPYLFVELVATAFVTHAVDKTTYGLSGFIGYKEKAIET